MKKCLSIIICFGFLIGSSLICYGANGSELKQCIADFEKMESQKDLYTQESWNDWAEKISEARLFNVEENSQEDVDIMVQLLNKLKNSLILVSSFEKGNVDGREGIKISDAMLVFKNVVGKVAFTAEQQKAADIDGNSKIEIKDAMSIFLYVAGKITSL